MTLVKLLAISSLAYGVVAQSQYRQGGGSGARGGSSGSNGGFGGGVGAGGFGDSTGGSSGSLEEAIPGIPGDDYPILAEVPETSFLCDGQADGGYYADPEAQCQAFHICANDGNGGRTKYSFLCPNGTLFQQQYFVCDWWFNVDCSLAEQFYSINDANAAERAANSPAGAGGAGQYQEGSVTVGRGGNGGRGGSGSGRRGGSSGSQGSASSPRGSYSGPAGGSQGFGNGDFGADSGYGAPSGYSRRNTRGLNIESSDYEAEYEEENEYDL